MKYQNIENPMIMYKEKEDAPERDKNCANCFFCHESKCGIFEYTDLDEFSPICEEYEEGEYDL